MTLVRFTTHPSIHCPRLVKIVIAGLLRLMGLVFENQLGWGKVQNTVLSANHEEGTNTVEMGLESRVFS